MSELRDDRFELILRLAGLAALISVLWLVTQLANAEPIDDISLKPVVTDTLTRSVPLLQPVSATILRDESGEIIGIMQVDILAYASRDERNARQRARAEREARRKNMSTTERIGDHLRERWPWYVGAVASAVVVDRAADANGWLWHKSKGGKQAGGNLIGDETATGIANSITGDGNSITQTIIIQQGAQTGAANTGTQSELEKAN